MVWLLEQALAHGRPGDHYWWCAPVFQTAKIAYRRYHRALHATNPVTDITVPGATFRDGDLAIILPNDATIWFKSMEKPDTLYGEDVRAAVIDEATRCREESWHAVRSTLTATRGRVRIIGNVKGRKNWAYRLARQAERLSRLQVRSAYHYAKLTAWDAVRAGVLDRQEILDARAALPRAVFRQLYLAEPADDGGNPFGLDAIRACITPALSPNPPAVWGWDLARWQDYTAGVALDRAGAVCRLVHFQHRDWQATLQAIREATGRTPAWVDATHGSVGDPIIEFLQQGRDNYHGFAFTAPSKQQLIESLVLAVQRARVHYPPGLLVNELESFEYEFTRTGVRYTAPEGEHDDLVVALALANYGRAHLPMPGVFATRAASGWQPPGVR